MDRILAAGGQVEECMGQYRVQGGSGGACLLVGSLSYYIR